MNEDMKDYEYSDEETLNKTVELIKKGYTYEYVQKKYNLSDDDIDLIDFVINEF